MLTLTLRTLAGAVPERVAPPAGTDLELALAFLDSDLEAGTVVRAGWGAGLMCALVATGVLLSLPLPPGRLAAGLAVAAAVGIGVVHGVHQGPLLLADVRRTTALGDAPELVARAVLRQRIDPNAEAAAAFAGRTGDGPLAESLTAHVRTARGTAHDGLAAFGREWTEQFPPLERATALLGAAAGLPASERADALDRALAVVLEGTREATASFASDVRAPATGLYAFGVLLPTALVATVPAAGVAGAPVSLPVVVAFYDVLLPLALLGAGGWLLTRRPTGFPPPRVDRTHPDVPDSPRRALAAAGAAGLFAAIASSPLATWTRALAVVGATSGVGLLTWYRPIAAVRADVCDLEAGLPDALSLVGRRVARGEAVETAIERTATELTGPAADAFAAAARRGDRLRVGVEDAFVGPNGALTAVPSPRVRGAVRLLALAAGEGPPAGEALVAVGDSLAELRAVEEAARRDLDRVTGTLRNTAAVFGPVVAGATVALASGVGGDATGVGLSEGAATVAGEATAAGPGAAVGTASGSGSAAAASAGLSTAGLGLAVGSYALAMAVVLTALATVLEHGLDRALLGYRIGRALCLATPTFLLAVVGAGAVV